MIKNIIRLLILIVVCPYVKAADLTNINTFLATNPNVEQIKTSLIGHKFSCKDIITAYLNRIRLYNLSVLNKHAPLNAITQLNPQALADAEKLDDKLAANQIPVGSLLCIPVIVKDNIDVGGLRTSSGSLSLFGTYPLTDSEIVRNIKNQGGIILAKSSMDEIAAGLYGISSLSGRVGNAYNSSFNPGGSSSGSAVSVAAGFAPLALGSDNSGSVRIPAAFNGIYGLRPTYGLISHNGIFPMGNLDGTAGPMANNVTDLANLLTVLANSKTDYATGLNEKSLSGKHFAIIKSVAGKPLWNGMSKPILDIYNQVTANLHKDGATITEINLPDYNLNRKNNIAGTIGDVAAYLAGNISSISQFNQICRGNTRVFGTPKQCLKFVNSIKAKDSPEYQQVINMIAKNQAYLLSLMKKEGLDGLILPSGKSGIASYDGGTIGDQSIIASNSGLPEITFPVAQYNGLPVGVEILGASYTESSLLSYAFAYQQHYYAFKAPKLLPDPKFNSWNITKLNMLYPLIGKISFDTIIKPSNQNKISPEQSANATSKAIALLEAKEF